MTAPDKSADSSPDRDPAEQEKITTAVIEMFEHKIRFNEFLGFEVGALTAEKVEISFAMRDELIGHFLYGRLHGGVISAVLDATGGLAVMWGMTLAHQQESARQTLDRFAHLGTIDLRVDYLRSGVGERFTATGEVVRLGRRIATTRMSLTNETGREIAIANASYIVS